MADQLEGLRRAIEYIEKHLTEEISPEQVAREAYLSTFHFQRVFSAICGVPLGEYVRRRRLTRAGEELSAGNARVLDVAIKYGYDSPDSFARAFARFHGILPSAAREMGKKLNAFLPISIADITEGGSNMEYRIVEKQAFTVVGISRQFDSETSYQEIPRFWQEYFGSEGDKPVMGMFGVCLDGEGTKFDYMIADNYQPWADMPAGCRAHTFPAGAWAVFPCRLSTLQDTNTRMWKEFLPSLKEYQLGGNYNLELYASPEQDYVELWLPLKKL